jgi:metal-responsive CopG/Arc/MetJ family transcriptional regulator
MKKTKMIFDIDAEIVKRIDQIAADKGYKTRNAFIRDLLWNYILVESIKSITEEGGLTDEE